MRVSREIIGRVKVVPCEYVPTLSVLAIRKTTVPVMKEGPRYVSKAEVFTPGLIDQQKNFIIYIYISRITILGAIYPC